MTRLFVVPTPVVPDVSMNFHGSLKKRVAPPPPAGLDTSGTGGNLVSGTGSVLSPHYGTLPNPASHSRTTNIDKIGINTSTLQRPRNPPPPAPPAIYTASTATTSRLADEQSAESLSTTCPEASLGNPLPPPRKPPSTSSGYCGLRRCRALYDCEADNEDELSFREGDVIVVTNEHTDDDNWMEGFLERAPERRGMIPISFVHMLQD